MTWRGATLALPPSRGRDVGKRRGLMFTSAVHAAAPHNAAMNIRLFLGGLRPPRPSRGWGNGEPRFPHPPAGRGRGEPRFPHHTPLREPMFTSAVHAARAAQRRDKHRVVPGRAQPSRTLPRVGAWGNPVSPGPCGAGRGETRFPHTLFESLFSRQALYAGRTTPRYHDLGARAFRPRRGAAGTVTAPLPSPPPAGGRESGSSLQRGG